MGKAFSEDERTLIKEKLMEAALTLYHDKDSKSLNIRKLAEIAGISPGAFYNFFPDKEALITEIIRYRSSQKLYAIVPTFSRSLDAPTKYLTDLIYGWCIDLKKKTQAKSMYKESLDLLFVDSPSAPVRTDALYRDFLNELYDYWKKNNAVKDVDIDGLINVLTGVGIFLQNNSQFTPDYFDRLLYLFIQNGINEYITLPN